MSYRIISYHILSYIISYIIPNRVLSYHIILCYVMSYHIMLCHVMSYHIISNTCLLKGIMLSSGIPFTCFPTGLLPKCPFKGHHI